MPARPRNQLPHCYYEGYLEKSFEDKASRKLWTCLCGNTLFFFNNNKDSTYVEKLELTDLVSLSDDCIRDKNLDAAKLILHMKDGDIKMTVPSLEARELWKGFIYTVVQLSVPDSLNLLPGQIHMLRQTLEEEMKRRNTTAPPPPPPDVKAAASSSNLYLSLIGDMPGCYQPVSRIEAEMMLERHSDSGNLLLRPGSDGASLVITTRQELNGSVFKHYRVSRKHDGRFAIVLENPILCATLDEVIRCLVEKTNGALTPLIIEGTYEENIRYVQADEENGEKVMQCVSNSPTPPVTVPAPPPKPGKRECMPIPELETVTGLNSNEWGEEKKADSAVQPQAVPTPFCLAIKRERMPTPQSETVTDLNFDQRREEKKADSAVQPQAVPTPFCPARTVRKALKPPLMPPVPRPRSCPPTNTPDASLRCPTVACLSAENVAQTLSAELKLKLKSISAPET
ncbi:hypothetical protein UPYG_G00034680 [Umbra pygmaea]|uniref:SH2 domain-containing protein n=1 Tax=Umbra pygmaea TaxID=75934 RepID=A0ABD0Y259_UMBPY